MSDATAHKGSIEPQATTTAAGREEVKMHAAEQGMELRRTNVGSKSWKLLVADKVWVFRCLFTYCNRIHNVC
jgi:hypothetical protein